MLPANYRFRLLKPADFDAVIEICQFVYPTERPYTAEELADHLQVFPQGQFAAVATDTEALAGVHFTLRLRLIGFHLDDSWDLLTAGGSFLDHNPVGPTLYGADIMVFPGHQHHGIGHALDGSGPVAGAGRVALANGWCKSFARLWKAPLDDASGAIR